MPLGKRRALEAESQFCHQLCGTNFNVFIPAMGLRSYFPEVLQGLKRLAESKCPVKVCSS